MLETSSKAERQKAETPSFNSLATRYDFANAIMSLGLIYYWRREFVRLIKRDVRQGAYRTQELGRPPTPRTHCTQGALGEQHSPHTQGELCRPHTPHAPRTPHTPRTPQAILDLGTGTGKTALSLKNAFKNAEVTGVDASSEMIRLANSKTHGVNFFVGCAERYKPEKPQDLITVTFVARNLQHLEASIHNIKQCLCAGGAVYFMEFSKPTTLLLRTLFDLYSLRIMPKVGSFLTGESKMFAYFRKSLEKWGSGERLIACLRDEGFEVKQKRFSFGAVRVFRAHRSLKPMQTYS
jgi:demethylmenaquinone methyltransferase/2-methoxy-6-polyprenyl-1,4-benzoquinol methylase